MCAVVKMQAWALQHEIKDTSVLPILFRSVANAKGQDIESLLDVCQQKPDLSDFLAEMAREMPQYCK